MDDQWTDLGPTAELAQRPLQQLTVGRMTIALSCVDGRFAAVSGVQDSPFWRP